MNGLFPQLMLDLETLSSEPNAPIIQIGAVPFAFATGEIGERLTINVCPDFAKTPPSLKTVCWWLEQNEGARLSVAKAQYGKLPAVACEEFRAFAEKHCAPKFELWAMPPEFDCVILANTFRSVGLSLPWAYNKTRDLRTLEALAGSSSAGRIKADIPHDAGSDAEAQAKTAIMYWRKVIAPGIGAQAEPAAVA